MSVLPAVGAASGYAFGTALQNSPLVAASAWVEGILLGPLATTVAVLAVAGLGFLLLTGRISAKRGITILCGCFILFGSRTLAQGILAGFQIESGPPPRIAEPVRASPPPPPLEALAPQPPPLPPPRYDPYAGAAVPPR